MDSILTTVKKLIGITEDYTHFDQDIIVHINSAFSTLNQLGVGPENGFRIFGSEETWDGFSSDPILIEWVKTYVYLKTRLIFDSSSMSSYVLESIKQTISELEFRMNVYSENNKEEV